MKEFLSILLIVMATSARPSLAVLDLESQAVFPEECATISDKLRNELVSIPVYDVVERNQMAEILKEQGFQQAGCTSSACAVEAGQLIGVSSMIAGNIGRVGSLYVISLRQIDVATGKIIKTAEESAPSVEILYGQSIKIIARKITSYEYFRSDPPITVGHPINLTPKPLSTALHSDSWRKGTAAKVVGGAATLCLISVLAVAIVKSVSSTEPY